MGETAADYKRFSARDIFPIFRQLKDQRDGAGSFEVEQAGSSRQGSILQIHFLWQTNRREQILLGKLHFRRRLRIASAAFARGKPRPQ